MSIGVGRLQKRQLLELEPDLQNDHSLQELFCGAMEFLRLVGADSDVTGICALGLILRPYLHPPPHPPSSRIPEDIGLNSKNSTIPQPGGAHIKCYSD